MSEWCRQCGEGADKLDDIIHGIDCPTWARDLKESSRELDKDIAELEADDEFNDLSTFPDRHADCTHARGWRSDYRCELRHRKWLAAERALGGL